MRLQEGLVVIEVVASGGALLYLLFGGTSY